MSIGSRLKQARKAERLTQEQLAAKAGLKQSTISDLENGKSASSTSIATLAHALGVSALWLETGKGDAARPRLAAAPPPTPKVARMVLAYEEEEALLDLFRRTDDAGRTEIMETAIEQARAAALERRRNQLQSDS